MGLEQLRKFWDLFLVPLSKLFIRVDPNHLTVASFLFAILAGASFAVAGLVDRWD